MSIARECGISHCDRATQNGTLLCKKHRQYERDGGNPNDLHLAPKWKQHGLVGTPTYTSWKSMKHRCQPTYVEAEYYYHKGITVCDEWLKSFANFLEDMGERPEGTSIDRIDGTKGYYKGNCRWASNRLQSINKGLMRNNSSGYAGVHWKKSMYKWKAIIKVDGVHIDLGSYTDFWDAVKARNDAEERFNQPLLERR